MELDSIVSVSSGVIALSALIFSIYSFKRQQERADAHEKASVKPFLSVKSQNYSDLKSIKLVNYGVGPAVITKAEFRRSPNAQAATSIVELFNLNIVWESFVNIPKKRAIPAEEEMILVKQSLNHLTSQGFSHDDALTILREWKAQKTGILVYIEYEDIYGNKMESIEETLN